MKIIKVEDTPFYELPHRTSGRKGACCKSVIPFYKVYVDIMPEGVTSFVAASDLQGREVSKDNRLLGVAVADVLSELIQQGTLLDIDFALLMGDFYDYPDLRKLGGTGDVTEVWNTFALHFNNVIGVHGNHDIVNDSLYSDEINILDGTIIEYKTIDIAGICGIIGDPKRNQRKSSEDFLKYLNQILNMRPDILLLHQGPEDPINLQRGHPSIWKCLEAKGEILVFFGHSHWDLPFVSCNGIQMLNTDKRVYVFEKYIEQ